MNTVVGVYAAYFGALAIIGVAAALTIPFMIVAVVFFGLIFAPSFKQSEPLPSRPLTDAEAKLQIVKRLAEHLESDGHLNDGDDCPVPEIMKKLT